MKKNILSLQHLYKIILTSALITGSLILTSCDNTSEKQVVEEVKPAKGVITEIEEGEDGQFKIVNEKVIDDPEKSLAVVHYADGKIDTLTNTQIKEKINEPSSTTHRSGSGLLTGVLMYSMMSRFMGGGNSNFTSNPNMYKTQEAYNNSNRVNEEVRRTSTRSVRNVSGARSGYGSSSSRSTRSYGG